MLVALNSLLHADGDTKTYRNVLVLSFFLNIGLNPLFIFGYGFVPAMGIAGIGVATIVAQFIGLIIVFNKVIKSSRIKDLSTRYFYPKSLFIKQSVLSIGSDFSRFTVNFCR